MRYPAQMFAEDTGIDQDLAERLMKAIYDSDNEGILDIADMNGVLWNLKNYIMQSKFPELLNALTDEEIDDVIDQMVTQRKLSTPPYDCMYAESVEDLREALKQGPEEKAGLYTGPETAWFFSQLDDKKNYKAGDVVTVQILRAGEWKHPAYGDVKITPQVITDIVKNFKENKRGIDLAVDENHDPDHKALAWFREVYSEKKNTQCFAKIELTQKGADTLNDGSYKYFSPEFQLFKKDEETGEEISNLLIGGALTNRPFFKGMQPLMASESATAGGRSTGQRMQPEALFFSSAAMFKLMKLMDALVEKDKISASEKSQLEQLFSELSEQDRTNPKISDPVNEVLAKFDEDGASDSEAKPAEGDKPKEDDEEEDEDKPEAEGEVKAPEGVEGVQANEDGTMTITDAVKFAESIKGIQTNASKLSQQFREIEMKKALKKLQFSEKNDKGILLPKHLKSFTAFAMKLSEPMAKEFFEVLGTLDAKAALAFKEMGTDKDVEVDPAKPESFTADDDTVQFFMEKMGQSLEDAQKSASRRAVAATASVAK